MSRATRKKVPKKQAGVAGRTGPVARDRVITFRISADEAALIARAADRAPLARYSRDAVVARAQQAVKARK